MIPHTRRMFLAAAAALALLAPAVQAQAADTVRVGIQTLGSHAPSVIAERKGYFAENGIEIEFVSFQAAQPMAVAIASGDVDFGLGPVTGGLIGLAERGAVKVIGGALEEDPDIEGHKILVSKAAHEAGLTSPDKLAGKRFGITQAGSSFHYMAHKIADKEGFDRASIELVPLNSVAAVVASLRSGQIDAWAIQPSIANDLLATGDAVEIGAISDYIDGYQVTTLFTSSRIAAEQRDLVERYLAAFSKGVADYNAAFVDKTLPEEEVAEIVGHIHTYLYTERPLEVADPLIRAGVMRMGENARLSLGSINDQLEWFKSENLVPATASIETLVDASFVETY